MEPDIGSRPTKQLYRHRCMGYIGWRYDVVTPHGFMSEEEPVLRSDGLCQGCLKLYLKEIGKLSGDGGEE